MRQRRCDVEPPRHDRSRAPEETRPAEVVATQPHTQTHPNGNGQRVRASAQVDWWVVHEYVAPLLDQVKAWPLVGSVEWCQLGDDDPVKLAALFDAARHWALRVETCQQAACEPSHDVSAAADWACIAERIRAEHDFYATHSWLKRAAS